MTAIALTIAGSDSSGGAGIQADLKTFSANAVYGASVIAALTAQNTRGVQGIFPVSATFVAQQMASVFNDLPVRAVKIGMLADPDTIRAVRAGLDLHRAENVVLDPVMVAASGDPLLPPDAIEYVRGELLPRADLITPNLPEAGALLDEPPATSHDEMARQARALTELGARSVLIKGGHGTGRESIDLFFDGKTIHRLAAPRTDTKNTHGTGCTLSSAIAAGLARGRTLHDAVEAGKYYVTEAIKAADSLEVGGGNGPVHHFHALWPMTLD